MPGRFVIYFHYDPGGQADNACLFAVRAMREECRGLLFVTNGRLNDASRAAVQALDVQLLERENTGFDVGAYRDALMLLKKQGLKEIDELILMNYTLAGPVAPLRALFAKMDARPELDFWGLTRHYAMKSRRFKTQYGEVPEHIQSHFIAVRTRLLNSEAFWTYWETMPLPQSYEQSVAGHEARFTRHFADLGYRWDTAVDTGDLRDIFVNPIMACPQELAARRGCPFFKRRSFFTPYADELRRTDGTAAAELYHWLKTSTDYPVDDLIRALLRTQPLAPMAQNLHWNAVLPRDGQAAVNAPPVRLATWCPGKPAPAIAPGEILCLYRPPDGQAQTPEDWYTRRMARSFAEDETLRNAAGAVLAAHPLAGIAAPAVPAFAPAQLQRAGEWQAVLPALRTEAVRLGWQMPIDSQPLPVPYGDCVFLRGDAFPQGLPPLDGPAGWWLLPLAAQQAGYGCLTLYTDTQTHAIPDQLDCTFAARRDAKETAKDLARILRRRLRSKH